MLLEKIKQHAGKISFFVINMLLVGIGTLYVKQRNLEQSVATAIKDNLADSTTQTANSFQIEQQIANDKNTKTNSAGNTSGMVTRQQSVSVTKTIPAVTQTVTVPVTTTSPTPKATSKKS